MNTNETFFDEGDMNSKVRSVIVFGIFSILTIFSSSVLLAAPHRGKICKLRQPDGAKVTVRVWGDEYYQRVESLDGYTLIRDAEGWISYAELSEDAREFVSTGVIFYGDNLKKHPAHGKDKGVKKEKIRGLKKESWTARNLDAKVELQKQIREMEKKQGSKRKHLFQAQDEVDERRDHLIEETQKKLEQSVQSKHLFTIRWTVT